MSRAVLQVEQAGPLVSLQDAGRLGFLRYGVTRSGPMDRAAFAVASAAAGGPCAIEVSLGGLTLTCLEGELGFAVAGGDFKVELDGVRLAPWCAATLSGGSVLKIRPGGWGAWAYVALSGTPDVPAWLGNRSTLYGPDLGGRRLVTGDRLALDGAKPGSAAALPTPDWARPGTTARVVIGPQDRFFTAESLNALTAEPFAVTAEADRMGVRLKGPRLDIAGTLDMPSEPIARGSLQVPGHGDPIVLLADHQTTGGYPKIATLIGADQDGFAQRRGGESVRFEAVTAQAGITAARKRAAAVAGYIASLADLSETLTERLLRRNLIGGVVAAD